MELEQIKNKLTKYQYEHFLELKEFLDLPLYFMGSIMRKDYIKGKSDLDVEIFTDNIRSTKLKIESKFNFYDRKEENAFIVYHINNIPFSGYKYCNKIKLKDDSYIMYDLTLCNYVSKDIVLYNRFIESDMPFINLVFINILKFLYHYLNIIDNPTYSRLKRYNLLLVNPNTTGAVKLQEYEYKKLYNDIKTNKKYMITI
jgi:hypothetical protein